MDEINYIIFGKEHFEATKKCLFDNFFGIEPMTKVLQISSEEIDLFLEVILGKAAHEGLSLVAINSKDEIVGCIISDDYFGETAPGFELISDKFHPIFCLLEELGTKFRASKKPNLNAYFHLFMITTKQRGIAKELTNKAIDLARNKGFKYAILEATGPTSQHISENTFHFEEIDKIEYSNFKIANKLIFQAVSDAQDCKLYLRNLN
ncbi:MAG: hypothetical protein HYR91_07565 [Flavobacteriia bacterium]|nr:hypothetical protein [Flavobacteriia bacterium]